MPSALETLSNDLAAAVEQGGRSTVAIHARRRIPSSGVIWRPGVIVAAHHTVKRDDDIPITLDGNTQRRATVVGRDASTDLVVLRLADAETEADTDGTATVTRSSDPLRVGQLVLALGRPGDAITASWGAISAVGGEWRTWQGGRVDQFVRLDMSIYDGFSGGPLLDASGRTLGINTSGLSRSAALTVPAATVDRVVDQLLAGGRVARGYLGIGTQPVRLPDALRERLAIEGDVGLMLVSLEPTGPAEQAGLLLGDVLLSLDGTRTTDAGDVMALLGPDSVGRTLEAHLLRAGEAVTVAVLVGEHTGGGRR